MGTNMKCKQCEEWRHGQPCNPRLNTGTWSKSVDGMKEAQLLTLLEKHASVECIMQTMDVCEAWIAHQMLVTYGEGFYTINCSL